MSIVSDLPITVEEAREKLALKLLAEQEELIAFAVAGMEPLDLEIRLNQDSQYYHYMIVDQGED